MKTYIRRDAKFYAIQFTGDNREKILDALKIGKEYSKLWKDVDSGQCRLFIDSPVVTLPLVQQGDWIVITRGLNDTFTAFSIYDELEFKLKFEELK